MTTTSVLSYLAVACSVLVAVQLIAAQSSSYESTQALGNNAATTMKKKASDSLSKISSEAAGLSKNDAIVNDATSKIEAAEKDGQAAIDSAVATAKSDYEQAGADQTAVNAAGAKAETAINAALAASVTSINAATDAAITAIHAN
ncbi:hypothetical protein DdX_15420 [Ditylenchus destructor]|uniref:Uncharacterized protein n=1 Tax=Ditylenchus destructor TaxID=166010 RepID=A0AAD4MQW5_9BILA|nr:hypothetical protein DdX_15420 [Ditylenchus destructor]